MRRWLPCLLSIVAGVVDTTSYLALSHLFAAHVTGNLVVLAASLVAGGPPDAMPKVLAIMIFIVGVALASQLGEQLRQRQASPLRWLLVTEAAVLAGALAMGLLWPPRVNAPSPQAVLMGVTLVTAMAVQNALNPLALHEAPPTTVMTMNLAKLVADGARLLLNRPDDRPREKGWAAQAQQVVWPALGFAGGCAIGAVSLSTIGFRGLAVPLALICLGAATVR